ncbi:MAG: hypothetical protein ACXVZ4_06665 [Gaiellaceae bacterium]
MRRLLIAALVVAAAGGLAYGGYAALREDTPDPMKQAVADGCQRSKTAIYTGQAPNWVYVNDNRYPASGPTPPTQWLAGVVDRAAGDEPQVASRIASSDDPLTHLSYDVNIDVKVDPQYRFVDGTNRDPDTTGRLHAERESGAFPLWALAEPGDRVTMLGSWVWDCDHFEQAGEFTEFHPFRAYWLERPSSPRSPAGESEGDLYVSTEGTITGVQAECAHRLKPDLSAFRDCVHTSSTWLSVDGDYHLSLPVPPRPSKTAQLVVRVVDRGSVNAPPVNAVFNDAAVQVSFSVNAAQGQKVIVAKQVYAGWKTGPRPVHLRVHFDRLLVRRSMDGGGAAESTLPGQAAASPGEWLLYWDVGGIWGQWKPTVLRARDGQSFAGSQTVDLYVPSHRPWRVFALARECDFGGPIPNGLGVQQPLAPCPKTQEIGNQTGDDYPGDLVASFRSPEASLGRHVVNASTAGSSCPPSNRRGCYQLTFTVSRQR